MKLSDITPKTKLVSDFTKRLAVSSKQAVPIVDVERVKRVSGASVRPVKMVLENGQTVVIYLRLVDAKDDNNKDVQRFDIFRIDINGKSQPLAGDFDNSYKPSFNASVDQIGATIRNGQAAFTKKLATKRVKPPTASGTPPQNKSQQRNTLIADIAALDEVITTKTEQVTQLEEQLNRLLNPDNTAV